MPGLPSGWGPDMDPSRIIVTEQLTALALPIVVTHGGVDMEPSDPTYRALESAGAAAHDQRFDGGIEAALAAVAVLEDDAAFNCGYGSVLTRAGTVETDGAVSCGASGAAVGVGAVPGLRHPARLAYRLMREENAVLLVGGQAAEYAAALGMPADDLVTQEQRLALEAYTADPTRSVFTGRVPSETVGCITVDDAGRIASASSTGGLLGKLPGRVGDACVAGAGFWTDDRFGVLCSGSGEAALGRGLARSVAARAREVGLAAAVQQQLEAMMTSGTTTCAIVAVDAVDGQVVTAHNGASFPVVVRSAGVSARLGRAGRPSGGDR